MMKVFVLVASVLVAQCQLHPAHEAQRGQEAQKGKVEEQKEELRLSAFPESIREIKSDFNDLWKNRLAQQEQTDRLRQDDPQRPVAHIILSVKDDVFRTVMPQDKPNPLYDVKNAKLTDEYLKDSLHEEKLNLEDQRLVTDEGLKIQTIGGKEVQFRKNPRTGAILINGVNGIARKIERDAEKIIFDIDDFLFDYRQRITDLERRRVLDDKTVTGEPRREGVVGRPEERREGVVGRPEERREGIVGRPEERREGIVGRPEERREGITHH